MTSTSDTQIAIVGPTGLVSFSRGMPLPLGSTLVPGGVNFSVYARHATALTLVAFLPDDITPVLEAPLDPSIHRTGDIWHILVHSLPAGVEYGFRAARDPELADEGDDSHDPLHHYDPECLLIDPYAHLLVRHGERSEWRSRIARAGFDWGADQPLNRHPADSIIYELNVRSFTRHPSSGVAHPGTYAGVIEKIPYLKKLGVTAIELLPVTEHDELELERTDPTTGEELRNLWGYNPLSFFALKTAYASTPDPDGAVLEFKRMVKALHEAGIEIILDMVYNHTGEGGREGPTSSFRGLDNETYYLMDPETGEYRDYSGCGNTLNCNHPVVRDLIIDSLRYWVTEMHVDGFRFDLAAILGRGRDGEVMSNPPVIERIAADPVLARTKLLAEAWDAAGLYMVGDFPAWNRWAEWNGKFRDDVRRFIKGDPGITSSLASRLLGSPDLYQDDGRSAHHSINFITSHDGFTLNDLVSYNEKDNLRNGEANRDGSNHNNSWNCGVEGPSESTEIRRLRVRQMKNFATLLMFSHGVPMIVAGDEVGRTQHGNNNAYCQDNDISYFQWQPGETGREMLRFFQQLIAFRREAPIMSRRHFASPDGQTPTTVNWHGTKLDEPDWSEDSRSLVMELHNDETGEGLLLLANAFWETLEFELPELEDRSWRRLIDTYEQSPGDIAPAAADAKIESQETHEVRAYSTVVLLAE